MAIIAFSSGFEFIALYLAFSTLPVIIFFAEARTVEFYKASL